MGNVDDHPRSFQISHGRSDLLVLFAALAIGTVLIAVPEAGPWIMRATLVTAALLLLRFIVFVRRTRAVGVWQSSFASPLGVFIGVGVLGFWIRGTLG